MIENWNWWSFIIGVLVGLGVLAIGILVGDN